jgi:hypothetical protein
LAGSGAPRDHALGRSGVFGYEDEHTSMPPGSPIVNAIGMGNPL